MKASRAVPSPQGRALLLSHTGPGLWPLVRRVTGEFFRDSIPTVSGGITFFVLLALFPAIASVVSLYGLLADRTDIERHLATFSAFLPEGAITVLRSELRRLAGQPPATLSFAFVGGSIIALWSASGGYKALVEGMNTAFDVKETRGFIRLSVNALLVTLAAIVFSAAAIGAGVVLPRMAEGAGAMALFRIAVWPLAFLLCALVLAVVYHFGPNRKNARWRWISWGSATAAILWLMATLAFTWYAQNYGTYNQVYGQLGALIGFLTWVWISVMIVLLGAEINAELET
ncbi:MAG TPA: YihY/virulence factor BrkB family protein [Rhizomicrobium sp.]|jgi:membrane protein|nr:YihY/virulence factor BrkB family protein [Rhizomicrobium sp.]